VTEHHATEYSPGETANEQHFTPSNKLWWKEPIEKSELIWIAVVIVWGIILTLAMPFWHVYGKQNLSSEAYHTTPEVYMKKVQTGVDQHTVRTENGKPVVKPPVGSDVYMLGRLWEWWPALELQVGQSYRLHLASMDWQHGFSLQPANLNIQVLPGYDMVMTVTPNKVGEYSIVCNEYCGIGHHMMLGKIHVVE
jgi:cytochrome c oxidase subunit 2